MSDRPLDLNFLQAAVRVGLFCALTALTAVAMFAIIIFVAGTS
jgi:hypothetical protein